MRPLFVNGKIHATDPQYQCAGEYCGCLVHGLESEIIRLKEEVEFHKKDVADLIQAKGKLEWKLFEATKENAELKRRLEGVHLERRKA